MRSCRSLSTVRTRVVFCSLLELCEDRAGFGSGGTVGSDGTALDYYLNYPN